MALGLTQILGSIKNLMDTKNTTLEQNQSDYLLQGSLFDNANADQQTHMTNINNYNNKINEELAQRDALAASSANPMNKVYSVDEFVSSQGMCGMGMGMGSFTGAKKVQLSGNELIALSSILSEGSVKTDETDLSAMVTKLGEAGVTAKVGEDKKSIEITHKDGSTTKIYDANGNGGLDTEDYNFNKALNEFSTDLSSYKDKMTKIETEVEDLEKSRNTEQNFFNNDDSLKTQISAKMEKIDASSNKLSEEVKDLQTTYDATEQTQIKIAEQNAQAYAKESASMVATAQGYQSEATTIAGQLTDAADKAEAKTILEDIDKQIKTAQDAAKKAQEEADKAKADADKFATTTDDAQKQAIIKDAVGTYYPDDYSDSTKAGKVKDEGAETRADGYKQVVITALQAVYADKQKLQALLSKEQEKKNS